MFWSIVILCFLIRAIPISEKENTRAIYMAFVRGQCERSHSLKRKELWGEKHCGEKKKRRRNRVLTGEQGFIEDLMKGPFWLSEHICSVSIHPSMASASTSTSSLVISASHVLPMFPRLCRSRRLLLPYPLTLSALKNKQQLEEILIKRSICCSSASPDKAKGGLPRFFVEKLPSMQVERLFVLTI